MSKGKKSESLAGESARARTVRLSNRRVSNVLKCLDLVGNLFGVNYQLTEDERVKVLDAIDKGVRQVKDRAEGKPVANARFTL